MKRSKKIICVAVYVFSVLVIGSTNVMASNDSSVGIEQYTSSSQTNGSEILSPRADNWEWQLKRENGYIWQRGYNTTNGTVTAWQIIGTY